MKRRYSVAFEPPAPTLPIRLRAPDGIDAIEIEAKIDTGADLSCAPASLVTRLDLPRLRVARAAGFSGPTLEIIVHGAEIGVGPRWLPPLEIVPTDRSYVLLGRNALRHLVLTLDGPRSTVEVRGLGTARRR